MKNANKKIRIIYGVLLITAIPVLLFAEKGSILKSVFVGFVAFIGSGFILEAIAEYRKGRTSE